MKLKKVLFMLLVVISILSSCSGDDGPPPCRSTEISMVVNGELQTFSGLGWGIDAVPNGYRLQLNFYRNSNGAKQNLVLIMPYKKTGSNVIDELFFSQYKDGTYAEGDLVNDHLVSKVIINRSSCFYATFSGKFTDGDEEIVITDGKLSWEYDEPLSE